MQFLSDAGAKYPRALMRIVLAICLTLMALVALPTLMPASFSGLHTLKIDTDPENMLSAQEPVRVSHNAMKKQYNLHDMLVVGIVNNSNKNGVFNPQTLNNIYKLTEFAKNITWKDKNGNTAGVIGVEVVAPSTVDNIEQAGKGSVSFSWLMPRPITTDAEAIDIRNKAKNLPLLDNTLVSDNGKAIAIYLPITAKNVSYKVAEKIRAKTKEFTGEEQYLITGLPVAQDQFGVEMFKQMAMSAPMAMVLIFLLMWYFFRNIRLIISPMLVALASVVVTMGALVVSGQTVHIMSSMIPIFIMPIAVLDAVHILSDFFDTYPKFKDRRKTLEHVMNQLNAPMLYTSITTTAGFGSLALTPIPPVQTFGIFVAFGVVMAWFFTVTMVPAYIMLMSEKSLKGLGQHKDDSTDENAGVMGTILNFVGKATYSQAKFVLLLVLVIGAVAGYGITKIQVNDNPVKWFEPNHPIRVADKILNKEFAGTYMAYLNLTAVENEGNLASTARKISNKFSRTSNPALHYLAKQMPRLAQISANKDALIAKLNAIVEEKLDTVPDEEWDNWDDASLALDSLGQDGEVFKTTAMLNYIEKLQAFLQSTGYVGKSSSLADVVKTVHRELFLGEPSQFIVPEGKGAIAQTLISFQNGHRPSDLWHFVTQDYTQSNLWIQLKTGDNKDMKALVALVDGYLKANPAPTKITHNWFGLTYINVVWQDKMVKGMGKSFLGSFIIVLLLMVFLFRSPLWGALAMVPLIFTIVVIYGLIGLIGKDYDMPVAVLSSLSLGLAVDYAIHFLARSRKMYVKFKSWKSTAVAAFGEPARAITRNVIVLGVGFMPLLAAPLRPYKTVGVFISAILVLAGIATLLILPALIKLMENKLFKKTK